MEASRVISGEINSGGVVDQVKIHSELTFRTSRSSGAGGQHVNKVESKVELFFSIPDSEGLEEEEKAILLDRWASRLTSQGVLRLESQATRSQFRNKEKVIEKFWKLLEAGLKPRAKRIATRPSQKQKERRLQEKKRRAGKKAARSKVDPDNLI